MSFKKYNSIENSYRQKHILRALSQYPELTNEIFIITEKIDGANIQLYFEPNKEFKVGKRSSFLKKDDSFFDIWNVLDKYKNEIERLQRESNISGNTIRIFGEIYGEGIQKRVQYGDKKICFFDVEINGKTANPEFFYELIVKLDLPVVPYIGIASNLNAALDFNENFDSKVLNIENNPAEGIVIKPYKNDYELGNGQRFILKKKSDKFSEKMNVKSKKKTEEKSNEFIKAQTEFNGYINDNRLKSIFSKHGEVQDMKEFGKYIKLVLDDAKEDFDKDYDTSNLTEKELKKLVKSSGKNVALLLKQYV